MITHLYTANGKCIESFENFPNFPTPLLNMILAYPEKEKKNICKNKFEDAYYKQFNKMFDPNNNIVCPDVCNTTWMQENCFDTCKKNCKLPGKGIDIDVEPLQAMIQLCFLSKLSLNLDFGTKLKIYKHILYLQQPTDTKWYNISNDDDINFLFQVLITFITWYHPEFNKNSIISLELYQLICIMSIDGLKNLLKSYIDDLKNLVKTKTYKDTINLYIGLLEISIYNKHKDNNIIVLYEDVKIYNKTNKNIDMITKFLKSIYDKEIINIIYNTLLFIHNETKPWVIQKFVNGLNIMLSKNDYAILDWIDGK